MSLYTVLGGKGFIGKEIVSLLLKNNMEVFVPERGDDLYSKNLGIVIYCIGAGDCVNKPFDVLESNTTLLSNILQNSKFDKIVYISSTRLYMNNNSSGENDDLLISNNDPRKLFNLTKMAGEDLCLKSKRDAIIVRPSNVYGLALNSPLFLPKITRDAIEKKVVNMFVSQEYEKDYVSVNDVSQSILELSQMKEAVGEIFNIASGYNTSALSISNILEEKTGCEIKWNTPYPLKEIFPVTEISKLGNILKSYKPRSVLEDLAIMIDEFKSEIS